MVVFISSVRKGLEVERDALPGLISALGHDPRRFEDFTARPVPPRQACLDGVSAADVYLMLLGERYGERTPDTGLAPTEEEFNAAERKGIPIIVMRKAGITMEPDQASLAKRIEEYDTGRFRASFDSPTDLLTKVAAALREVEKEPAQVIVRAVGQPVSVAWLGETGQLLPGRGALATTLEVHVIPIGASRLLASALEEGRGRLIAAGRHSLLFTDEQAVTTGADAETVWASTSSRSAGGGGIRIARSGAVAVWRELQRDSLGTILSVQSLTDAILEQVRLANGLLLPAGDVTVTAALDPVAMATEGDPSQLGRRSSATISRFGTGGSIRLPPEVLMASSELQRGAKDVARELAIRLLHVFRASN